MTTSLKNKDSELQSRNAHSINGTSGSKKWILYTTGKDPLLGFVHAPSETEALDRVRAFKIPIIAVEANATTIDAEPMTPERIAKDFKLFGSIIPASTVDGDRKRTPYFYRKEAINWARFARKWHTSDFARQCRNMAKTYLFIYKALKKTA